MLNFQSCDLGSEVRIAFYTRKTQKIMKLISIKKILINKMLNDEIEKESFNKKNLKQKK